MDRKPLIIDCHGHYTTAPQALASWRDEQIAGIKEPARTPRVADLQISDDEIRESIEPNQLRVMTERGVDLTIFSPRASFMAHHIGDLQVSSTWAAVCNELCHRVSALFPENFAMAAMLPQSPGEDPATCIPELDKCVNEYGAVAVNLNPDPSGGTGRLHHCPIAPGIQFTKNWWNMTSLQWFMCPPVATRLSIPQGPII